MSFASMLKDKTVRKTVKLAELTNDETVQGATVVILLVAVEEVMLQNSFFFFQFASKEAYSEIGLSLITTKLGKPIMLDGYTSNMCINSWSCNSYVRALIEVSAKNALMDSIVVAIPLQNGSGHTLEAIDLDYEWQPPHCDTRKKFDHNDTQCPKKAKVTTQNQKLDNGFMEVTRKNGKGKHTSNLGMLMKTSTMDDESLGHESDSEVEENIVVEQPMFMGWRTKPNAPPIKTPRKIGIWLGRKADSPKRNVVFSPEPKIHYFDRDDEEMMMVDNNLQTQTQFKHLFPVIRRFSPDDPFFASGNIERELLAKQVALDITEDEKQQLVYMEDESSEVFCPIVGCGAHLKSLAEFEDHYNARHTACCSVCSRVYPTSRLLSIHVSEVHDSFFQAKVARGYPMYECLVEGCGEKLKSYKSRHQHLIDKHSFPSSFEFFKKTRASKKGRVKKNQRKQHQTTVTRDEEEGSSAMQIEEETLNDLVSAVSKLNTSEDSTPSAISFGRRHTRGVTFVPRAVQRDGKK
ncbi:zinc finger protein 511 [Tanacetum coccineum]|uniref:Zinc finger protein 511 n=1 Tax=Tanacetum coccineum TaxID=301880 RepID=A0ABQ5JB62_9ASTR